MGGRGYIDFSKSVNAVYAEEEGRFPASVVARKLKVPTAVVYESGLECEYHHTSKFYNSTDFYDLEKVREWLGTEASQAALAKIKGEEKKQAEAYENCIVEWLEWGGSRKHPKCTEKSADGCHVELKGQTATITFRDGRQMQKRLNCSGFSISRSDGSTLLSRGIRYDKD